MLGTMWANIPMFVGEHHIPMLVEIPMIVGEYHIAHCRFCGFARSRTAYPPMFVRPHMTPPFWGTNLRKIYIYNYIYIHIYIRIQLRINLCVCVHTYIYLYKYTHTHSCIHSCLGNFSPIQLVLVLVVVAGAGAGLLVLLLLLLLLLCCCCCCGVVYLFTCLTCLLVYLFACLLSNTCFTCLLVYLSTTSVSQWPHVASHFARRCGPSLLSTVGSSLWPAWTVSSRWADPKMMEMWWGSCEETHGKLTGKSMKTQGKAIGLGVPILKNPPKVRHDRCWTCK